MISSMQPLPHRFTRLYAGARLLALALAVCFVTGTASAAPPEGFSELIEKVKPTVVKISARLKASARREQPGPTPQIPPELRGTPFEDLLRKFLTPDDGDDQDGPGGSEGIPDSGTTAGSGFIVTPTGYIVTSNHVIAKTDRIQATLADGRRFEARVAGRDEETDIALLKIDTKDPLPAVTWGDSDKAHVGDWVLAIGNPFGLGGTVTAGIISARGREIQAGRFDDYLQIDAAINRGNSGGPLFDRDGRVIGVNTAIYSVTGGSIGIGFAVPSAVARPVVEELRAHGRIERGWLGVDVQAITREIADGLELESEGGVLVVAVTPNGPSAKAGVRIGDAILSVNGTRIAQLRDLRRTIAPNPPRTTVVLSVWREGRPIALPVVLGRTPDSVELAELTAKKAPPRVTMTSSLGLGMVPINRDTRLRYGLLDDDEGVLVIDVRRDSPASEAGFQAGDVIVSAANRPIAAPSQVGDVVRQANEAGRKAILFLVRREGKQLFIAVPLPRA